MKLQDSTQRRGVDASAGRARPLGDHHPPHVAVDGGWLLVSASTVNHDRFLADEKAKEIVRDAIKELIQGFDIALLAWVVLDNHYHLLLRQADAKQVPMFCQRLHGRTSRLVNLEAGRRGRQIWHNYWDSCVRSEADLWTRFNYIHQNPVKHRYVARPEEWAFSSYGFYRRTRGDEWLRDCWERYPVVDFMERDDI